MRLTRHCASSIAGPQFVTAPVPARLNFHNDSNDAVDDALRLAESDSRLETMLAAQAAFRGDLSLGEDEDKIAEDANMSVEHKTEVLQKALNMAASNGDVDKVKKLLEGKARLYVDVNGPDEEGTSPLIYASCFVGFFGGLYVCVCRMGEANVGVRVGAS